VHFGAGGCGEAARVSLCRCDSPPRYSITSSARAIMPALRTAWPICAVYGLAKGSLTDMSEQPIQDINDGKPWSEMDVFDLRHSLAYGRSIEEVAGFLCRSGTVEVRRKAEELGLQR
jgi:hypothetical protein